MYREVMQQKQLEDIRRSIRSVDRELKLIKVELLAANILLAAIVFIAITQLP